MTMIRKLVRAEITALADDEVEVVISTAALARDGHVLIPQGCQLDNYRLNPIVLWSHDANHPVGNAEDVVIGADKITARVKFAPNGISRKADEVRGLTKANVIRAVSVGFEPIAAEPLDAKKPKGGQRISTWELLEFSFVSVPADTGAMVTARANGDDTMPDPTTDAGEPAAGNEPAAQRSLKRPAGARAAPIVFQRGLYGVAQLCYLFESLGYQLDNAQWEAAIEEDNSKVPAMLGAVLQDLGDVLLAMTKEEVAEALAGHDLEPDDAAGADDVLVETERAHILAAPIAVRAFRRGLAHAKLRAGKSLSADSVRCLREASACHEEAMTMHRTAMRKHKDGMAAIGDMMARAGVSDPDDDTTQTVQKSNSVAVDDGARMSPDYRSRQAAMLGLTVG